MLYNLDVFLHANRRSSFRSCFEITELLTYSDANYSIGPHQKCYVRNLKRGGGEFWVAQILKELLSQLSAIWGSCPHPFCRRGQKGSPQQLSQGRVVGESGPKTEAQPPKHESRHQPWTKPLSPRQLEGQRLKYSSKRTHFS